LNFQGKREEEEQQQHVYASLGRKKKNGKIESNLAQTSINEGDEKYKRNR
jgi:hypothetical protein